ncbi:hypothetical protein ACTWQB_16890, partial [Piscibacillus sp. B03]|uniref:hypothetical protein n=1 Tax=Piscibacillus sp. B03 TaxID=3457430 RepID=UPI003FCC41F9
MKVTLLTNEHSLVAEAKRQFDDVSSYNLPSHISGDGDLLIVTDDVLAHQSFEENRSLFHQFRYTFYVPLLHKHLLERVIQPFCHGYGIHLISQNLTERQIIEQIV